MIGKKVLQERWLTDAETRALLEKRFGGGEEPNYIQKTTLEHLQKFIKLTPDDSTGMVEALVKSSEKMKPEIATKIANLLPKYEEDVRAIFAKERFALTKEEIGSILGIVAKYAKE